MDARTPTPQQARNAESHATRRATPELGERLRQLRVAAGLTQTDVAGTRFSKEYISQIERGKTRPTQETVQWLAAQLGVDAEFLAHGVSVDQRVKVEAVLARAEALAESTQYDEAISEFERAEPLASAAGAPALTVRLLNGQGMALALRGDVREGLALLQQSRDLVEGPGFTDLDRAEVLYRLGVCRYLLSSISTAVALFDEALALGKRSGLPTDELQLNVFSWRSRCYRRQRDFEAAREDVERALELADALRDPRALGNIYFQASLLADRGGQWVRARSYAEKAKAQYELVSDQLNISRLLNNLGGLAYLLGNADDAIASLKQAFAVALDIGREEEAAISIGSLAQVHLGLAQYETAEEQARQAIEIFGVRDDHLDHLGNAWLVLGRSQLEQDRLDEAEASLAKAEDAFEKFSSASYRAAAWIAQGDLATRRGDEGRAALLYRRAAEALQDIRF
jgi:tetratricopeptide (TPR) repeat protein